MNSEEQQLCSRFIKPEKLSDLRNKQEIEVMNGRSWTRELPPPPVLPPYGPLEKIRGRLESFRSEYFREYFGPKAYRTNTSSDISVGQRGAASATSIVAGSPGAAAVIMAESESANNSAEYVQGMIKGRPFRGWVGVTRLQAGDEVDMIAEWQHDHYEVYAIALAKEHIVSIYPQCDMGHIAHMLWRIKNMFILIAILMVVFIFACIFISLTEGNPNDVSLLEKFYVFLMMAFVVSSVISGLIAFFAYKAYSLTCCKLAEEIFKLLGMKNVSAVNLNKVTKEREQGLIERGQWHDPSDKYKSACPSAKFIYSGEWWFYY